MAIPNAVISLVIVFPCAGRRRMDGLCVARPSRLRHWSPNITTLFIDHSSRMWNFHPRQTACSLSMLHEKGEAMRKTLMALAAAATLAVSAVGAAAPAHAQRGLGAAVAGGLIGGAIVGGAIASQNGYYGPGYGYYGGPAYVAGPGYGPPCVWQRQRFWDGYGWRVRNVRVCD
jgi:hypothetical protein